MLRLGGGRASIASGCSALPFDRQTSREFWGRRWNAAFSEMTAIAIYQPLVRVAGRGPALAASFLGSGLLHELAISVPVRAGYGLPMAYFMLQGVLMTLVPDANEARCARAASLRGPGHGA